jgi:isovaleryl-CoA dehydrogenase
MEISSEHLMIQDTVRKFIEREIIPRAEMMDRESYFPDDFFPKAGELGLLGVTIPEEYGGTGLDPFSQVLIMEEIGKGSVGLGISYAAHANLCMHNLYHHGNEYLRNKYLPDLCAGTKIGALALTEPGAGSDALGITTTAKRDGDVYRLNGTKMFITNAPIADVMLVYAKTDKSMGGRGMSAFIVEKEFEGYSVSRELEKMGCKCSPTGEVVFEDCIVPAENILRKENEGLAVMMSGLDIERLVVAANCLGCAEAAFAESVKYSKQREQFGKPICEFQLIKAKLADMYTGIEAARLMIYDLAMRTLKEPRLRKESAAAILFTAEMATKVCLEAVQIHGGYGYMLEFPVNRYLRDIKLLEIGAGTSEIRRLLIADEILK